MDAASVEADILKYQNTFQTLSWLMLTNYLFPKQATLKNGDEFDFIIAGGGTAGCVLANRLAATNCSVLLLEAGDIPPYETFLPGAVKYLMKTRLEWNYTAVEDNFTKKCHKSPGIRLPTGRALGGSSALNFMVATRGTVNDYQIWAAAANDSSWEFKNLIPYFKRSVRLQAPKNSNCPVGKCRGVGGNLPDSGGAGNIGIAQDNSTNIKNYLKAFAEMGNEIVQDQDLSGRHSVGYGRAFLTITEGYRQSTGYGYLVPAKKYSNLFVSMNTLVTKIIFDKDNNAIGVKASVNGKKPIFLKAKKEVIVCAGALKSPQLLMLSGIGPKKDLEGLNITVISDLPVGENFRDQEAVTIIHATQKVKELRPYNYHEYAASAVIGLKSLKSCAGIPDYATFTFIEERPIFLLQFCTFPFDFQHEICNRAYQACLGKQIAYTQIINLFPKSKGKVMLNTTNPHDAPLVYAGYFSNKDDVGNLIKYVKDFLSIENTTYFNDVNATRVDPIGDTCNMFEPGTDDYWSCYMYCMSTNMWNYSGTCSMGAVVDSKLKVFRVNGLRVVDASVMPSPVAGSNYVPTIVVAEKASDMIIEDHKGK